jgi:C-terminal processing protease CtpA/Prc
VEQRSGGRLAYVHLRSSFDRSFRAMVDEVLGHGPDLKGVVVDDRYNPGGSLTSDLMAFLTGRAVMVSMAHGRSVGQEAGNRWTGPSLLLVNEGAYSDGACLAATYQREGIGKLVGMPIAGTCILSISELLQDDATIFTAPTVGVLDPAGKVMEGTAVQPDMTVRNEPRALAQGRDLQLEAAVQLLLQPATPARR